MRCTKLSAFDDLFCQPSFRRIPNKKLIGIASLGLAALTFFGCLNAQAQKALPSSTTLTVSSSGKIVSTLPAHAAITLTATVQSAGRSLATGQINFCDAAAAHCTDIHLLGMAQLTKAGKASITIIPAAGDHSYKAVFAGTKAAARAESAVATLTVTEKARTPSVKFGVSASNQSNAGPASTSATLTETGQPGSYNLSASITGVTPGPALGGTVSFLDLTNGNALLGSAPIVAQASNLLFNEDTSALSVTNPQSMVLGDFNGDGNPDIFVAVNTFPPLAQVLFGDGAGGFVNQTNNQNTNWIWVQTAIAGDFNADGNLDVASVDGCAVLNIQTGIGDGTFSSGASIWVNDGAGVLVAADFNGDGIPDLAVTGGCSDGLATLLLGDGTGNFNQYATAPVGNSPSAIATGDFNGDGIADLAVTDANDYTVTILLGNGDGSFYQSSVLYLNSGLNAIVVADFNGDGNLDLAVAGNGEGVDVLLGDGQGNFTALLPLQVQFSANLLAVADFNGDGIPDLAITNTQSNTALVLTGNGDGTFAQTTAPVTTGAGPSFIGTGSFNGDGATGFLTGNFTDLTVSAFLSEDVQYGTATLTGIAPQGAGQHSVQAVYSGQAGYSPSSSNVVQLGPALITPSMQLTVAPSATLPYGQFVFVTATLSGALNAAPPTGVITYTIDNSGPQTLPLSTGIATIVLSQLSGGQHSIAVIYGGDQNYTSSAPQTVNVSVSPASQTINPGALPSLAYGSAPATLTATATSNLPVTFSLLGGPATLSGVNNSVLTVTGAGVITLAANQSGSIDYAAAPAINLSLVVAQAPLSVYVNSVTKMYGQALPFLGASIFGLLNGDSFQVIGSSTATSYSDAGTYPITAVVNGAGVNNYNISVTPGTLLITKAPLLLTALNAVRSYGASNPTLLFYFSGFVNGDNQSTLNSQPSITTVASPSSPVGSYPILASIQPNVANNYNILLQNGVLNITQATSSVAWINPAPITYGRSLSRAQLNATATVPGTFTYTPVIGTVLTPGVQNLSVAFTPTDAVDYSPTSYSVQLTVNQAAQAITFIQPATPVYFGAQPTTLSATGGLSGNPVTFSIVSGPGTLSGVNNSVLTTTGTGALVIAANQAATPDYLAAPQLTRNVVVKGVAATLTSPTPGTVLSGSSATFAWTTNSAITGYYLWIGSTGAGSNNIYNSAEKTATSYTFSNMPVNGQAIYVRLITNYSGTWTTNDYTYTAATPPAPALLTSPTAGSTFSGPSVTFTWTTAPNATGYYLWIGSTGAGSTNIYNSAQKSGNGYTFTHMPTNGEAIYVRLITNYSGTWITSDSVYTAAPPQIPAVLTSPAPGSSFSGPSVTFTWTAPPNATGYYLWIGSTGIGSNNLYNSALKTVNAYTFTRMPITGLPIYVRLITSFNGVWVQNDYVYTAK